MQIKKPRHKQMIAIAIHDGALVQDIRPVPKPKSGEVLIRVHAAGINRPDVLQRQGLYPPPPGITDIPGLEIAGEVVSLGRGVKNLKAGQKVCALVAGGGYAEYCVAPAGQCLPVPKKMSMTEAACLPETFFTVWRNLFDIAGLKKDDSLLIHGGAGGIGTTAIQMAKAAGAKVFTTAGSTKKCALCKKLGASLAIDYKKQDFTARVLKETNGSGVDIVLDILGGETVARNIGILKKGGRHVSIAVQQSRKAQIDIFDIMRREIILTGSTLRAESLPVKTAIATHLRKNIWPLLDKKKIRPVIDRLFTLDDAQAAHDHLDSGLHMGKVCLVMTDVG